MTLYNFTYRSSSQQNIASHFLPADATSNDMTVCIAAMADGGKKLILAADDMKTHGFGTSQYQQSDVDHKKVMKLNENVYALTAGALHVISPVIAASIPEIKPNSSPQEAAEIIRGKLQEFYIKKAEEEVLKPMLITLDLFRDQQRQLSDTLLNQILMKLGNFNLDVNIIVAGINQQTGMAFLSTVQGNGVLLDRTMDCAVTNGSGGDLARFSILLSNYSKNSNAEEVGKLVKEALIAAKKSPGVGDLGDYVVLPAAPPLSQQVGTSAARRGRTCLRHSARAWRRRSATFITWMRRSSQRQTAKRYTC